jgi:hypothetical protein
MKTMKRIFARLRRLRLVPVAAVLALGMMISPVALHKAGASLGTCAGCNQYGPQITLSNGVKLTTGVGVSDASSDTLAISYTVHVPAGVTVTGLSYQGAAQVLQSAQVLADDTPGTYDVTTLVVTGAISAAVYPYVIANSQATACVTSSTAAGPSNQPVPLPTLNSC